MEQDTKSRNRNAPDTKATARHQDDREFAEESDSLWRIVFAPTLWVLHFLLCYTATAIICSRMPEPENLSALRIFVAVLTLLCLSGIGFIGWRSWVQWGFRDDRVHVQDRPTEEHRHEFLGHASFLLSIVSFIAVCYVALPALFLGTCQ